MTNYDDYILVSTGHVLSWFYLYLPEGEIEDNCTDMTISRTPLYFNILHKWSGILTSVSAIWKSVLRYSCCDICPFDFVILVYNLMEYGNEVVNKF